ncbi:hypothetical protein ELI_10420 [Erythrobacter litoralis HTCC2594]|uniref:Uncharacterized protein n=1 Tax=Erythrobacter litoralis (strain HTCC2594) TaxID=314225 RepID=Q2N815_ERYLH|nr:hypothetical protein ELI_10420 [Erythrobacter litoralis HTCC2594]
MRLIFLGALFTTRCFLIYLTGCAFTDLADL